MTQPTSHTFGALPVRSWPSVVCVNEIVWSRHRRFVVTSALCVSAGEVGIVLERVAPEAAKDALPHQVVHWLANAEAGVRTGVPAWAAGTIRRVAARARMERKPISALLAPAPYVS